jgi:Superfamily II DNA helicase
MSLLEKALTNLIVGKRTLRSPVFLKDFKKENSQLNDLIELSNTITSSKKEIIERDIMLLKHGLDGEQNVYFELKNSFISMFCLHDIRLEYDDYVAQFDFILITNKFIMVLETKKLNGDIEITKDGDFIRTIQSKNGRFIKKEGMYSPISQNERHVNILKDILIREKLIKICPVKSAVVIANPKSIINKTKCPKSIQNNIFKYDQIATLLKKELGDKKNDLNMAEKYMYAIANFLIDNNKPITFDYKAKYLLSDEDFSPCRDTNNQTLTNNILPAEVIKEPNISYDQTTKANDDSDIYELLRKYRLTISREEQLKPYMIFNNKQLDSLISIKPKTKEQLIKIKGFGDKKVEKYGYAILSILNSK